MIYSAAVTRFLANSMAFLSPISVTSTEGGGGGGREGLRRGRRGVGEASTDVTPAKRPSEASNTTSQRKKARQPASKSSSQRKNAKQSSPSTRTSPRLHPRKDAQKELAEPRVLLPTIAEDPPSPSIREPTSPSDSDISHDILAPTQETVTTVPKTQLGGDSSKEEASEDEALDDSSKEEASEDEALEDKASEEEASNKDDMEAALEMDNPPVGNIYLSEDAPTNPFADEGASSNNDILGEFNDPYHKMLVESAIDYSFDDRLDYFLRGGPITMKIRAAVETCVLGEAGKSVSEEENVSKVPVLQDLLAKKYGEIMSSLNPRLFETAELREDMCTKRLGGRPGKTNKDTTFGVKKMWESWLKMKTEMKKIFTRLPANYHKMKSGTQLYDVYDNLIRDHWREAFVSSTLLSVPCQSQLIPSFFLFFLFFF